MAYDPHKHHRRSTRLQGYDYAQAGAYVITVVTHERAHVFGVVADVMVLNEFGWIAEECWLAIPNHFLHVELDAHIVMPNHVHGILLLTSHADNDGVGAQHCCAPTTNPAKARTINVASGSIGAIVRSYKSAVTKRINTLRNTPETPVWQRNYHDRIVRNERELMAFRTYIEDNPLQWALDRENKQEP